jgi:hypothetical protein
MLCADPRITWATSVRFLLYKRLFFLLRMMLSCMPHCWHGGEGVSKRSRIGKRAFPPALVKLILFDQCPEEFKKKMSGVRKHLDSSGQKSKANTLDKAKTSKAKDAPISKTGNAQKAKPPSSSEYDNLTYITSLPEEEESEEVRANIHISSFWCVFPNR